MQHRTRDIAFRSFISFHFVPFHSILFHPVPFRSVPFRSIPFVSFAVYVCNVHRCHAITPLTVRYNMRIDIVDIYRLRRGPRFVALPRCRLCNSSRVFCMQPLHAGNSKSIDAAVFWCARARLLVLYPHVTAPLWSPFLVQLLLCNLQHDVTLVYEKTR